MEYITPGVIITILILGTISIWLLVGRLWPSKIIDNDIRRTQLFRYLDSLGLVLSSRGSNKTMVLYNKAHLTFLATVKKEAANILADYNEQIIKNLQSISPEQRNAATLKLLNCIRKEYRIDKQIMKMYVVDLTKTHQETTKI